MEKECEITHIIGLDLSAGVYEYFFINEDNPILSDDNLHKNIEPKGKSNFIEIQKHAGKEKITKIYTKSPSLNVFLTGSWDQYAAKHKMLPYHQKLEDFWRKEKEFIGLESLKKKNYNQIEEFQKYLSEQDFYSFHNSHYDWWAFPIDEASSHGFRYTIDPVDAELLKNDDGYMKQYLLGVQLLAYAWGWDILNADFVENPDKEQCWTHWSIRLYKAAKSLEVLKRCEIKNYFDEQILIYLSSLKKYAQILIKKYGRFHYKNVNFEAVFPFNSTFK